jgi:hypothetical protein
VLFLSVDFTAAPGTQTTATLERGLSATGPWVYLRDVGLTGEVGVTFDTTVPLDTPVWYRWFGTPGDQEIIQGPFTEASEGTVLLKDPFRPWANLEFDFCNTASGATDLACLPGQPEFVWARFGDETRRVDAGLFDRLNSETPADVYGRRKDYDSSWRFFTRSLEAAEETYELFTAGGPLQIQAPAIYGIPDDFMQPLDLDKGYLSDRVDQRLPYRIWNVPVTKVDRITAGPVQGTECSNWCTVEETFPTFADMTASGGTWMDVAEGEVQCPGGEPVEPVMDSFTRSVAAGWGVADSGQTWTLDQGTAANFSVNGTMGVHTHTATNQTMLSTIPYSSSDVNMAADTSLSVVPTGDSAFIFLTARVQDSSNFYAGRLLIVAGGGMSVAVIKRIAGVNTTLATFALGLTYVANTVYRMRFAVQGNALMAKVWLASNPEPAGWQVSTTDPDITTFGRLGMRSFLNPGVTNPLPITFMFDNLVAVP